ncbi:MAG: hypothetical protein ACLFQV_04970 [Vulcanimicrobiota bacterium]
MDKPTLSPQTNKLLEVCQGVLEGQTKPRVLMDLLDEMYQGLEKAQADFMEQLHQQNEEYIEQMKNETDMVFAAFEAYEIALNEINSFFQNKNPESIKKGMDMAIKATGDILDSLTIYESKSLQLGPTSFPILNMLILLTDSYKKGEVKEDEFRFMIYNAGQFFEKLIDETEKYDKERGKEAIESLREGYERFIKGLENLDEAAKANNELMMDDALEIIRESQEAIKKGFDKFNDEMFLDKPTESPYANLLINTIEGVREGTFPKELLQENLEKYQEHIDSIRIDVEGISTLPIEDEEIVNELPKTIEGLDLSDDACELIRQYMADNNAAHLEAAINKLKESTELLKESQEKYEEIGEREGKIACVQCATLNEAGTKMCVNCGAILPVSYGETISTSFTMDESGKMATPDEIGFVMTDHMEKLVNESARVRDGMISFEEYSKTLDWMESKVRTGLAQADKIPDVDMSKVPDEEKERAAQQQQVVEETRELLKEGLKEMKEALDTMRLFGRDEDVEHLRKGLEMAIEASIKIQQVEKLGEQAEQQGIMKPTGTPSKSNVSEGMSLEDNAVFSSDNIG